MTCENLDNLMYCDVHDNPNNSQHIKMHSRKLKTGSDTEREYYFPERLFGCPKVEKDGDTVKELKPSLFGNVMRIALSASVFLT